MADGDLSARHARWNAQLAELDASVAGVRAHAGRAVADVGRRIGRAIGVLGAAGVGAVGYAVAVAPIGVEGLLIGVPVVGAAALGVALLPTRRKPPPTPKFAELPSSRLAASAREWLDLKRVGFPGTAAPACRRILDRLAALGPVLAPLPEGDPTLMDARRLLSDHLPRLIDAWTAVPPAARAENADVGAQLTSGLGVVADELDRLWTGLTQEKVRDLAAEGRFLETRYRGEGA